MSNNIINQLIICQEASGMASGSVRKRQERKKPFLTLPDAFGGLVRNETRANTGLSGLSGMSGMKYPLSPSGPNFFNFLKNNQNHE